MKVKSFSHVHLLATPWTAAYQAAPSMGFSRQEYWSGVPFPSPETLNRRFLTRFLPSSLQRPPILTITPKEEGFPDSSVSKESTCNAGDPGSTPGSGRSIEEGIGYPYQYSWASLVA